MEISPVSIASVGKDFTEADELRQSSAKDEIVVVGNGAAARRSNSDIEQFDEDDDPAPVAKRANAAARRI